MKTRIDTAVERIRDWAWARDGMRESQRKGVVDPDAEADTRATWQAVLAALAELANGGPLS